MKKQILIAIISALVLSLGAYAHAPKKIKLSYDKANSILKADILHKVKDVSDHYISDIIVYVNDEEITTTTYEKQTDKLNEIVEIPLENIKNGDVIKLKAKCNKFGSKSAKIKVE